jgi:pimeloyl-ACP methyl ester carboxylesterase
MRRIGLAVVLALSVVLAPLTDDAQQVKVYRIGVLNQGSPPAPGSQPGVLAAALNYYRHTFHPSNRDPALQDLQQRVSSAPTPIPTLALHGTRDRPGRLEAFEGMDDLFLKGLEKVVVPGAGHFLLLERPSEVNQRIVEFFRAASRERRPTDDV